MCIRSSYKGGRAGFLQVPDKQTLRFPSYDGNGMYRSLGNIQETGKVAMLFIRQNKNANRIRIHGSATVLLDEHSVSTFEGAEAVVEVEVTRIFPNCPRYIHDIESGTPSEIAPGGPPPPPEPGSSCSTKGGGAPTGGTPAPAALQLPQRCLAFLRPSLSPAQLFASASPSCPLST